MACSKRIHPILILILFIILKARRSKLAMAYLTSQELLNRFKIKSQTTLWRWQQPTQKIFKEPFPSPIKVSVGSKSLWDEEQIIIWENQYFRNNKSLTN